MTSWQEFWSMGGYAAYVWPAYGLAAIVVAWNVLVPLRRLTQLKRELRERGAKA